uniref:Uncharacterized protein AlNc14C5G760 n=1 Tax=Albugo laibachii Nc14 TaxID=890382 RepID=F0W0Y0_9STRA|nr:conserved hypothetical protein [Albugo laibachii Nc14]|eukprot:CCA14704.1 conserved hypothetical protein [Albugo laibachii Nc14]
MSTLPALAVRPKLPLRQLGNLNDASIDAYSNIESISSRSDALNDSADSRRVNPARVARTSKSSGQNEGRMLYPYQDSGEEGLNLPAGATVHIISKKHSGSYKCRYHDKVVYIPSSYLDILGEDSDDDESHKKSRRKKKRNKGSDAVVHPDEDWPQDQDSESKEELGALNEHLEARVGRKKHQKHRRHRKEGKDSDSSAVGSDMDQSRKFSGRDHSFSVKSNADDEDDSESDTSELPRHRHRRHHRSKRAEVGEADEKSEENSETKRHHRRRHQRRRYKEKSTGKEAASPRNSDDRKGYQRSTIAEENSSEEGDPITDCYHSPSSIHFNDEKRGDVSPIVVEKGVEQLTLKETTSSKITPQDTNPSSPSAAQQPIKTASSDQSSQSITKHDESRKNESVDVKQGKVGFGKQIGDKVRHLLGRKSETARKEASGILNSCAGTVQGEEGWYEHGDHERYYFTSVDNKWNLLYGPISEENFELYCTAVTDRNRMVELPPTLLHKSGYFLDRYFHVRKLD